MNRLFRIIGLYAALLLQTVLLENITFFSFKADIIVPCVIMLAIFCNDKEAFITASAVGLVHDLMCGRLFGIYLLTYLYSAVFTAFTVKKNIANSSVIVSWHTFFYSALVYSAKSAVIYFCGYEISVLRLVGSVLVKSLLAGVFSFVVALCVIAVTKKNPKIKNKGVADEG